MRRLEISRELCTGAKICTIIAPDVFEMDDEEKAYIVDQEGSDEETIQRAINQCPEKAIFWIEKE